MADSQIARPQRQGNNPPQPFCIERSPEISVRVPAGSYIFGDPGYAIPQDQWLQFLETATEIDRATLVGSVSGHQILALRTHYGEGVYEDNEGFVFLVDQGMIGLVPVDMPGAIVSESSDVLDLDSPIHCHARNGVLSFGPISIDTKKIAGGSE